ncbi:hypothetical protein M9H77_14198 [Catharanthus roseus]|uniref:Uncharacterized protein n=1 Tax=Catharanthus roseus TaxID=4058 RepID=A0ACC0BMC6_CATRO|nr:hypothetical protein M9H77_14198 [Catharanthus roseus]
MVHLSLGCQMGQQEGVHHQVPYLSPPAQIRHLSPLVQIPHLSSSRRVQGTGGCPPAALRPSYLRVPLLTPRAPQSGTYSRGRRRDGYTGNVCWISCCDGVQPKVPPIDTMHLRMIVCTFFAKTAICDGDVGGSYITTDVMSSTSCNMEV